MGTRWRRRIRQAWPVGLVLVLLLVTTPVTAHAVLESSAPPPNGQVPTGATVVALRFAESVDVRYTDVTLTAAAGDPVAVTLDRPPLRPDEVRVLMEPLEDDVYTLQWRALSVDGHPESGRLRFAAGEAHVAEPLPVAARDVRPEQAGQGAAEGVVRGVFLFAVLGMLGGLFHGVEVDGARPVPRRLVGLAVLLSAVATVGALVLFALLAQRIESPLAATLHTVAGGVLLIKAALAAVALAAAVVAWPRRRGDTMRRWSLFLTGLAAFFVVVVHSFGGHGVASEAGEEATGHGILWVGFFHLLAVAVWVGGLLALVVLAVGRDGPRLGAMVRRFSPWAMVSVVVLVGTGVAYAWSQLLQVADLWTTPYGGLLVAKSLGLLGLLGLGAWHQARAGPALRRGTGSAGGFRRSTRAEAGLMLVVLLLAGVLAATPVPAPAVAVEDPPLRAFEAHAAEGDHRVHLAIVPDPVVVDAPRTLRIDVRSTSFAPYAEDAVTVTLVPPGEGDDEQVFHAEQTDAGRFVVEEAVFGEAGEWSVRVQVANAQGAAEPGFPVMVQPSR